MKQFFSNALSLLLECVLEIAIYVVTKWGQFMRWIMKAPPPRQGSQYPQGEHEENL